MKGFGKERGCTILHSSALSGIYTGKEKRFKGEDIVNVVIMCSVRGLLEVRCISLV